MAKDSGKDKGRARDDRRAGKRDTGRLSKGGDGAVVAAAMGAPAMGPVAARPALPESRRELIQLWNEARGRRHSAPLGSEEFIQACEDVARIEVAIAAAERAMTPPRV